MTTIRILTAAQMRWADEQTIASGVTGFELMDRAGRAVADAVLEHVPDTGRILIIAGPGNNGGDGFAAAFYLRKRNIPVTVVCLCAQHALRGDAAAHARRAREAGTKVREAIGEQGLSELERWLSRSVMAVDAIFGTGLTRPLQEAMAHAVKRLNAWERPVLSIDIASGLDSDTGAVLGAAVHADLTLPIAASKWGHWLGAGRDYSGKVLPAAAIGIDDATMAEAHAACPDGLRSATLIDEEMLELAWPPRPRMSHKGDYGHVWIFGGSVGYTGAPMLAARGAAAAGAGLVSIVCPDDVWPVVAAGSLEIMVHPESTAPWREPDTNVGAIVAGPGWGKGQGRLLQQLLDWEGPLVLDADALNILAADASLQGRLNDRQSLTVLTPHPGEAARLLGVDVGGIQADRKSAIARLIESFGCWIVLKGNETLVGSPRGDVYLSPFGSPQMAVAGSGDVLAGVIAACLIRQRGKDIPPGIGIPAAVALHGRAGEEPGWHRSGLLADQIALRRQAIERRSS